MRTSPILRLLVMGVILVALNAPLTMMCGVGRRNSWREDLPACW